MSLKITLARLLHPIERRIDMLKGESDGPVEIRSYGGYPTPEGTVLRGRILTARPRPALREGQSKLRNAWHFLTLFATDEKAFCPVHVSGTPITQASDEEGYFDILVPNGTALPGRWPAVVARGVEQEIEVYEVAATASTGIISDIDDTMMRTGAYAIWLNLWTSITSNPSTREVFQDAVELMSGYANATVPVFYVSSSPWNMHEYLTAVFRRAGLPAGPMFLRDLGLSETQFVTGTHGDHKGRAIETILAANPNLEFTLIGDTGQHDAEIYGEMARQYPERISRIILRKATVQVKDPTRRAVDAARRLGVRVDLVASFTEIAKP